MMKFTLSGRQEQARPGSLKSGGNVNCGLFGISEDYTENSLNINDLLVDSPHSTFFFTASGRSMEPMIFSGDTLVVDCSKDILNNNLVIVDLEGERLCKRFVKSAKGPVLISENQAYKKIHLTGDHDFSIFGVVIALIRKF